MVPLTEHDETRIKIELKSLRDYLAGIKKKKILKKAEAEASKEDRWYIDIYSISMSSIKRSERKKNKGKSRKALKQVRSTSFLKSVVAQPGMIQNYKEGRMGLSPKSHVFKMRRDLMY